MNQNLSLFYFLHKLNTRQKFKAILFILSLACVFLLDSMSHEATGGRANLNRPEAS
jgi:hypothetical protein